MMKMYKVIISIFCLIVFGNFVQAEDLKVDNWTPIKDRVLHTGTTDKPVKVRWDSDQSRHFYVQAWIPFYETMADPKVTYKVYDNQTELSTLEIDQTDKKHNNRWVSISQMAVPISTGTLKIVLNVANSNKYAAASAVRIIYNGCEDKANGTQILGQATGTNSTGAWSDAGGNFLHKFGTGTPRKAMGSATYTWTFNGVTSPSDTITYDIYIKQFPTNQIYAYSNISTCGMNITIPRTGHYVFHTRTLDGLTGINDTTLNGKSYQELVDMINSQTQWKCSKIYLEHRLIKPNNNADALRAAMRKAAECSDWVESIDPTNSLVDCERAGWWVYGYPAPVGPIIIGN